MIRIILFVTFFCLFINISHAEEAGPILTGKVNPTVTRGATLPFNSILDEVLVKPGQPVKAGEPLLKYRLQDEEQRQLIRELTIGANTENLKGQVLSLEREVANTSAERNKTRQLVSSGLGSRQALARLDDSVANLKNRINLLNETIHKSESNFEIRLKELSNYFGQPIKAGADLPAELILTSPIDGYVLSLDAQTNPEQLLNAGFAPIQIGQMNPVIIRVPVYETDLNHIKVGDKAVVEIPSLGNREFEGAVTEISWISTDMNVANPSYYLVELTVPNPDLLMKPGFKAVARFNASHRSTNLNQNSK